jgi:hypothetical protein
MEAILKDLVGDQWDNVQSHIPPDVITVSNYGGQPWAEVISITVAMPSGLTMNFMLDPKTNVAMVNNDPYQAATDNYVSLSDPKAIDKLRYEVEGCLLRDRLVQNYDEIRKRGISEVG